MDRFRLGALLKSDVVRVDPVGGGDICTAYRAALGDGRQVFVKTLANPPEGFFTAEAAGLLWLAEADAVPVPDVLTAADNLLALAWVQPGPATTAAADRLGRELAALHRAGADGFGFPTPGFIGSLPLDNAPEGDWPTFYARRRVLPYLRMAVDHGAVSPSDRQAIERLCHHIGEVAGPAEPPARIHGDLWSGNVHWAADGRAYLIDPAAHGGHRETDLAMLALFGAPQLGRIMAAYDEAWPLADGWRERVPLHQLHPVLVHAALFGGSYGARAGSLARGLGG